jgi:uncharacterized protein YprB with RNaseH-like and TPR domain
MAAAGASRARPPAAVRQPRLEELLQGRRAENPRGEFFVVDQDLPADTLHGDVSLSRFGVLSPSTVAVLSGEAALGAFDLRRAVFLDTETTGLAGGTGTAAFLVGLGWLEGGRFRVRQYLMRDYHEEAALLHALAADLHRFCHLVTFNGRTFDLPLLEARFRLNREPWPLASCLHLDLLPPARRLWRARLMSCRLQSLETDLLRLRRHGDVGGEEIPRIYFDFVRRRDGRALVKVLDHNRLDVVSLAALSILACQWVDGGWAEDPLDVYCLARVYERARLFERSDAEYRRAADGPSPVRVPALLRLAARARRRGDHAEAARLWEHAADEGDWRALRALAIHHERRGRNPLSALRAVERALERLWEEGRPPAGKAAVELLQRRARLRARMVEPGPGGRAS